MLGPCLSYTNLIGPLTATDHGKRPISAMCKVTEICCPPRMHSKRQPLQAQRPGAQRPSPLGKVRNMKYHNKNEMLFKIPTDALIMDALTYVYNPIWRTAEAPIQYGRSLRRITASNRSVQCACARGRCRRRAAHGCLRSTAYALQAPASSSSAPRCPAAITVGEK